MSAKTASSQRAARTRRLKKRIQEIVDWHRSDAFNQCLQVVVKENPKGKGYLRWFDQAWVDSLKPNGT